MEKQLIKPSQQIFEEKIPAIREAGSALAPRQCIAVVEKFFELGYEVLPHPPYSPSVAPSDYFLLLDLEE